MSEIKTQLRIKNINIPKYEDRYTEFFREMFNHANTEIYHVSCSDQSKGGPTGIPVDTAGGVSSRDLVFYNNGLVFSIGEAIFLRNVNKKNIDNHIMKLLASGNNYSCLFMLIYYDGETKDAFWEDYKKFISTQCSDKYNFSKLINKIDDNIYFPDQINNLLYVQSNIPVLRSELSNDGTNIKKIYHICIDVRNQKAFEMAKKARGL